MKTCPYCKKEFKPHASKQKQCGSDSCTRKLVQQRRTRWDMENPDKTREYSVRYRSKRQKIKVARVCVCGNTFVPRSHNAKYCNKCKVVIKKERARVRARLHYYENRDSHREKRAARYWKNPDKFREIEKQRRLNNPQKYREADAIRYWKNPDKFRSRATRYRTEKPEIMQKWRRANADMLRQYYRRRYMENPEYHRCKNARWRQANPERHKENNKNWRRLVRSFANMRSDWFKTALKFNARNHNEKSGNGDQT